MSDDSLQPEQPLPPKRRPELKWGLLTPGQQQALREMERKNIPRSKQLAYFREAMRQNGSDETWSPSGLCEFWQSEREYEEAVIAAVARTRAVAKEILSADRKEGVTLEESTQKKLATVWALIGDALVNVNTPDGIALLEKASTNVNAMLNTDLRKREGLGRMEIKKAEIELAARRVTVLERKLSDAKKVVSSKLSPEEKQRKIKEIFGVQ